MTACYLYIIAEEEAGKHVPTTHVKTIHCSGTVKNENYTFCISDFDSDFCCKFSSPRHLVKFGLAATACNTKPGELLLLVFG